MIETFRVFSTVKHVGVFLSSYPRTASCKEIERNIKGQVIIIMVMIYIIGKRLKLINRLTSLGIGKNNLLSISSKISGTLAMFKTIPLIYLARATSERHFEDLINREILRQTQLFFSLV